MSDNPARKVKWMPIALVISLAVNLLVAGVVIGTVLRFRGGEHAAVPPGFGPALYWALPKEDRRSLRGELSGKRSKGSDRRKQDFAALSQALQAEPYDPKTVELLLIRQAEATATLQAALHERWLNRVADMSDAERVAYAKRLEEVVKRGPRKSRKKD